MLNEIVIPYIEGKRKELNLQSKLWLLIFDVFKGQSYDTVKDVKKSNGKKVLVPTIGQTTSNQ